MGQQKFNGFKRALGLKGATGPWGGLSQYGTALAVVLGVVGVLVLVRAGRARPDGPERPWRHHGPGALAPSTPTRSVATSPGLNAQFGISHALVLANGTRELYAELELTGVAPASLGERPPLAVSIVLDRSGSMSGAKIVDAKRAVQRFVDGLADTDHVSLVIYDDVAEVLSPLGPVGASRERIRSRIAGIYDRGSTNIAGGLALGARTLAEAPGNATKRVVLFSDGLDTTGTPQSVILNRLRADAERGVTISALGIGTDYDSAFMSSVAEVGHGTYAYLGNSEMLASFVEKELAASTGTVVDRAVVTFALPPGWSVRKAFGGTASGSRGSVTVPVGTLARDSSRRVTLILSVDAPRFGSAGAITAELDYRTVQDNEQHRVTTNALDVGTSLLSSAVDDSRDMVIWGRGEALLMDERQQYALQAWQEGRRDEARAEFTKQMARAKDVAAAQAKAGVAKEELDYMDDLRADLETGLGTVSSMDADSKVGRARSLSFGAKSAARKSSGAAAMEAPRPAAITTESADGLY